jgi:hypothetical protein
MLQMGALTQKEVEGVDFIVHNERIYDPDNENLEGCTLNFRFTSEGVICDLVHPVDGRVLRSMGMMYDEFIESVMT